jgi:hypothetical protein
LELIKQCYSSVAATGAQDLSVLMEVAELYCLVCPTPLGARVGKNAWLLYQHGGAIPHSALAQFAATCGEALLSIAEYMVEDVLLVSSDVGGASTPGSDAAAASASSSAHGSSRDAGAAGSSSTTSTPQAGSSSSRRGRPKAGGRNPAVTLKHRVAWAQDTVSGLGLLLQLQHLYGFADGGDS